METETPVGPPVHTRPRELDPSVGDHPGPPIVEPAPDGFAAEFAARFGPTNPVRVFILALITGWAFLVTFMVFLGLLLIHVILDIGGLREADEDLIQWLEDNRSPGLEDASWVGSTLAGGHVIPAVIGISLVVLLIMRKWLLAAFVALVVALESATYRATSLVVERERPDVERLEGLPVDASYPSGHTAASIALYGGILLLLASRIQSTAFRIVALLVGIAIPLFVGWARMYRGMHHLSDVGAGMLMGLGAVAIMVFAARASRAAAYRRDAETTT